MAFTLHGLAVSQGIAIGHAHLVSHAILEVAHYTINAREVPREIERFEAAIADVRSDLVALRVEAGAPGSPTELASLVNVHAMFLDDPLLAEHPRLLIRERRCNAEWALVQQMEHLVAQFEEIDDSYLRERKHDIVQVVERILRALLGKPRRLGKKTGDKEERELIIVAHDLSPADTIQFKNLRIAGFVTDLGGATSHTAIVARSLAIPAVVGLHHARPLIREDDLVIVDGTRGVLIVAPDERVLEEYRLRKRELELERSKLKRLITARATTLDDVDIALRANIELPQDIDQVKKIGADGVGLFRTEFLFMNRDTLPSEDEQFEAYRHVARTLAGKPVTIRTLDIGADKTTSAIGSSLGATTRQAPNPALGLRAIRYCLAEPQIFLTQLRAILRASQFGKIQILVPMLAHAHEIEMTLAMIELARHELRERRCKFDEHVAIGGMVEIPAAALALGPFLKHLNFLSIGTNDLIQYALAIDRTDETVAHLYDPLHPAVLRLVAHVIQTAHKAEVPVAVCGELAGDSTMTRLLLGMGLREFSMHPAQLLAVKQQIVMADTEQLASKVTRLLRLEEPERIREHVARL